MVYENLSQFGPRLFGEKCSGLERAIQSIERLFPMSDSYRDLLKEIGGAIVFEKNGAKFTMDENSPLNDDEGYQSVEMLFGVGNGKNSIEHKNIQYDGELPTSFVPIGEAPFGNLICADGDGSVHLWDHESPRGGRTWRIAASIDEFLERLEVNDYEIRSTEGIIKSTSWLDI